MKDRIRLIMEQHKMLQQDFAKKIGASASTLSGIFTGKTQPSTKIVQAIHTAFPDISTNWLLFGEGEMFTSEEAAFRAMLAEEEAENRRLQGKNAPVLENDMFGGTTVGANGGHNASVLPPDATHPTVSTPHGASAHTSASSVSGASAVSHPSLFDATTPTTTPAVEMVKLMNYPQRSIKEIRVFYDDGTYEDFLPGSR